MTTCYFCGVEINTQNESIGHIMKTASGNQNAVKLHNNLTAFFSFQGVFSLPLNALILLFRQRPVAYDDIPCHICIEMDIPVAVNPVIRVLYLPECVFLPVIKVEH